MAQTNDAASWPASGWAGPPARLQLLLKSLRWRWRERERIPKVTYRERGKTHKNCDIYWQRMDCTVRTFCNAIREHGPAHAHCSRCCLLDSRFGVGIRTTRCLQLCSYHQLSFLASITAKRMRVQTRDFVTLGWSCFHESSRSDACFLFQLSS